MDNYSFVPAYYEWHFIDDNGNVLLNMKDPSDDIYIENNINGQLLDEPVRFTTYDQMLDFCKDFIEVEKMCLDIEEDSGQGNDERIFDLPDNAAEIMAHALYDFYIAA